MEHIKRVGRELMYKGSMLEFYKDTIVTPDGKTVYWDHIEHKGAAAVVAVRDDGRIVMVRQFRNSPDKETLEIPAGGINKGEPVKTAAIRELEEETGYKADPDNVRKLISIITAVAFCNEKVDIYVADKLTKSVQQLDEEEYINVEYLYIAGIKRYDYERNNRRFQDNICYTCIWADLINEVNKVIKTIKWLNSIIKFNNQNILKEILAYK